MTVPLPRGGHRTSGGERTRSVRTEQKGAAAKGTAAKGTAAKGTTTKRTSGRGTATTGKATKSSVTKGKASKRGASIGIGARSNGLRLAVGRTASALSQWLRRPLTSLHLVLGVFGLLTLFGLVMVLSASTVKSLNDDGSSYSVFTRQLMFCVPGLLMFWLGLRIAPRRLRSLAPAALVIGALSLVAVLFFGQTRSGSRGWFAIGSFSVQPAEAVKVALILWAAHVLAARRAVMHRWKYALSPVVPVTVVLLTLVVLQPDLGMTVSIGIVLVALLYFGGAPMRLILALSGGALGGAVLLAFSAAYRVSRVMSFLSPSSADPLQAGFQARQALYSLADGGLFGQGLGQGRAKWSYLPNAHNDFIFAIVAEELGFIGAFAVLALFATLAYTGFRIAARSADPWLKLVVATATAGLVTQAAINIGYVVGLLPVTGLQLPLISSGGTSLVVTMFLFGLLANAARHEPEAIAALKQHGEGRLARLLRLPPPEPYRAPVARPPAQRGRVR